MTDILQAMFIILGLNLMIDSEDNLWVRVAGAMMFLIAMDLRYL